MVFGVTGKYCSGKNVICDRLRPFGFFTIDVDLLGHEALKCLAHEVAAEFGPTVTDGSGGIDRRRLAEIVFSDPERLASLESIVHPWMVEETTRLVRERSTPHAAVNAAILYKMGLDRLCDRVIYVHAPLVVRFLRARRRDGLGPFRVLGRLRAQRGLIPKSVDVDMYRVSNPGHGDSLDRAIRRMLVENGIAH